MVKPAEVLCFVLQKPEGALEEFVGAAVLQALRALMQQAFPFPVDWLPQYPHLYIAGCFL